MSNNILARPYARAVFQLAQEQKALAEWSQTLELLALIAADERVARVLRAPRVAAEKRVELMRAIAGDKLDEHGDNLVRLLAANGRLPLLPSIHDQFEVLRAEAEGRIAARVTSARKLTKEQQERIAKALGKRLDRKVELDCDVDEALLGGAVIRAGDLVIDGSLRGRLRRLGSRLTH
ncbi:MAG: F0F1 ATP synthase subunit delta [Halofilum sp. (in: g-proteobacteria)]|nr:F0F1 ATP synthase subunit delta [Halofilum sp. (in: g-proteobacteria)]